MPKIKGERVPVTALPFLVRVLAEQTEVHVGSGT